MSCYAQPHFGFFEDPENRRAAVTGVAGVEIVDRCFLAGLAAIEFSSCAKELFSKNLIPLVVLLVIHTTAGLLHCLLFHGPRINYPQLTLLVASKVSFVLLCLAILDVARNKTWESTGLLTFIFLTIAFIKFCTMLISRYGQIDMTNDWAYLIEFATGTAVIIPIILLHEYVTADAIVSSAVVGSVIGSFLSQLSLLDLHQNMRMNYWWWEDRMIDGCVYHVIRQYTFTCCKRIEEQPRTTSSVNAIPSRWQED